MTPGRAQAGQRRHRGCGERESGRESEEARIAMSSAAGDACSARGDSDAQAEVRRMVADDASAEGQATSASMPARRFGVSV